MSTRRCEGEESEYPLFEGDDSSSNEWRDYGVAVDDYEGPPVFDDDQYEEEIVIGDVGKGFVGNYVNFQEDENNVLFSSVVLGVEEESTPVYDTDIEDVIEEEERFVEKKGLDGEEDNIKDVVVVANDLCSSMIQTTLNVDFEKDINTKSHELMLFGKGILIKVSKSSFKFLIGKKYQEWYLKVAPMVDEFDFKTIKVRGRVIIKKGNLMQGIQIWMLRVQGTSEANSRTSFFKWGRMMR
uniref:Uncharacterized protein n=1 Tax=Tanacetum cinerariifolium TaxID=118510 RepID=A0A6L2MR77_TANCI|nr:hypothetical protein [Tanacetum cinerariifolium]